MTHPLTNALAMRTAAAAKLEERRKHYEEKKQKHSILDKCNVTDHERYAECEMATDYAIGDILALPLEADHAALVAEAKRLPEIAALIKAASKTHTWLGDAALGSLTAALQPFLALETP
ncbi:MAG: hypothetical protein Q8K33_01435 [Cypionkella sp.]|uniref:hypothetical protein n=1 Tax=Cypionkella sp. TaxID=2811411 RepID=UPI00272F3FFB|nr:hypothetical protein [Cypionkella sp.]MDP2047543.1 hypothetical protein [Cypionkella sp.]